MGDVFFAYNSSRLRYSDGVIPTCFLNTRLNICDHGTLFSSVRKMRAGRIGVAVKLKETAGELKVYAHADGLRSAVLTVETK